MPPQVLDAPSINGHRFDFTSIKLHMPVVRVFDIKSINYKHSLKPGVIRGTAAQKRGRTRGQYDSDGSISFYKTAYQQFIQQLLAANPGIQAYMEIPFDVVVSYAEVPGSVITDTLTGCRITDDEDDHSEGSDGLVVKASLDIFRMLRNGLPAVLEF